MTMASPARPPAPAPADPLRQFAKRLGEVNPFAVNRVDRLAADGVDVSHIHHGPYQAVIDRAAEACAQNRAIGAVLWGEAGAGKSHLLARLHRWAGQDGHACFVYLHNLLADPGQLPRYVLKSVVSSLTSGMVGPPDRTPLFRVLNAALDAALRHDGVPAPTSWANISAAYDRLVNRIGAQDPTQAVLLDRDAYRVLFQFFRSAYSARKKAGDGLAALAVRWLSGDPLDPDEAARLGLRAGRGAEDGVRLADDQQVKQVMVALTQLARHRRQPFLLCFDQVDNLGPERVAALAQFLHDLIDSAGNLLVVLSGVKQTLLGYAREGVIPEATWHRLAQHQIDLPPIGKVEGRHILERRLEPLLEPFVGVPEIKGPMSEDSLFPLGRAWYDKRAEGIIEVRPRRAIDWARERWEQQQARLASEGAAQWLKTWEQFTSDNHQPAREAAVDALIDVRLTELVARRTREPHGLPPSPENLCGLTGTLLEQCRALPKQYPLRSLSRAATKKNQRPPYDLTLTWAGTDGGTSTAVVLFLGTASATSAAGSLRRLLQSTRDGKAARLFLVTEQRLPLELGGTGKDYLAKLSARAAPPLTRLVLTFEQYALLDALQAVVGLARSGDLEVESHPRAVSEAEVIASHHRRGRYAAHPLLCQLLGVEAATAAPAAEPPPKKEEPPAPQPPNDKDVREFIMARLALTMGSSSHELADYYAEYRARTNQPPLPRDLCRKAVEEVARQLHDEGKLKATPGGDGLYLLLK
jgi:hypothetical protein